MADKSWFEKAKEAAAEGIGATVGIIGGAAVEAGSFLGETPNSLYQLFSPKEHPFREFSLGLEQMQKGNLDITKKPDWSKLGIDVSGIPPAQRDAYVAQQEEAKRKARGGVSLVPETDQTTAATQPQGGGKERVLQGLFGGQQAPRSNVKDKERLFSALPTYDATKKDLLNIGEGLVDLVGLASGIGGTEQKEAVQKETEQKLSPAEKGLRAGFKTGEELAGGLTVPGIVIPYGFTGGEGKRLIQEAPITYALNALPVLNELSSALKRGAVSSVRAAEINAAVRRAGFSDIDTLRGRLQTAVDAAEKERLGSTLEQVTGEGVTQAETPKYGFQKGTAPAARAVRAATELGERAGKVLPYAAAAYALGGAPAAVLVGGLAASPLLSKFLPATAQAKVRKKLAPLKRAVAERRTYETPEAQQMGEELLRAEGETAVISQNLEPFVEQASEAAISPQLTKDQLTAKYQSSLDQEKSVRDILQTTSDPDIIAAANRRLTEMPVERAEIARQINADPASQQLTTQEIEQLGGKSKSTPMVIDFTNPVNSNLLTKFDDVTKGTELENLTPDEKQNVVKSVVVARQSPTVWLVDDNLRNKVVDKISQLTGLKLKGDARAIVADTLSDISAQAFNQGNPVLLDVPLDNVLKPAAQQKVLNGNNVVIIEPRSGEVVVNANLPSLRELVEQVARDEKFNPTSAVLKRQLELAQSGFREKVVKPFVSPIEGNVQQQLGLLTDQFRQGDTSLPVAVKFDPSSLISRLRQEAVQVTDPTLRGNADYKRFLTNVADRLETLTQPKVSLGEGVRVPKSVATQPNLTNQYDYTLNLINEKEGAVSTGLGLMKRLATMYNPMTGLGNYLGNALVRMMNTGSPLPNSLLANELSDTVRKVAGKELTPEQTLQNEIVLRAVPSTDILSVADTNSNLTSLEKTKGAQLWRKGYEYGDKVFRIDEAVRQSKNLIAVMNGMADNSFNTMQVGPNILLTVQRVGNEFVFINPENGKILTRGTMESPAVKRIMGSAVKSVVDSLYPDVRELPEYYAKLAQGAGGIGSKITSAGIVFQPFLSYTVKAADTPWKRGILSTILEQSPESPILDRGRSTNALKIAADQAGRYFASRSVLNGMNARFNNLSANERDELRKMYSFSPAKQKPVIFGSLVELSNGDLVRRTYSPEYANFWGYSDDVLRGLAWAGDKFKNLYQKDIQPDKDNYLDTFTEAVMQGKGVTANDALRAAAASGGLLLPLYRTALESEKYGKPDVSIRDVLKPFGILGRVAIVAGEQTLPEIFKEKTPFLKPLVNNFGKKLFDTIIGTQLSTEQQPEKATFFLNQVYNEYWNNLIKPLADEANIAIANGDYATGNDKLMAAQQLNEDLQTIIKNRAESYNMAFQKLGIGKDIATKGLRFQSVKQKEMPTEVEPVGTPEPMPELPKETGDFIPPPKEE
jgi:hypothetical protein